jgi:DNA-directed RNA polymerase specialized sigma24 family protein
MEEALARLPVALAAALRLRRAGADDVLIAQALGIDPEGVETLISLAEAKLRRVMTRQPRATGGPGHPAILQGEDQREGTE